MAKGRKMSAFWSLMAVVGLMACSSPISLPPGVELSGPVTIKLVAPEGFPTSFALDRVEVRLSNGVDSPMTKTTSAGLGQALVFSNLRPGTWSVQVTAGQGPENLFSTRPVVYLSGTTSLTVVKASEQPNLDASVPLETKRVLPLASNYASGTVPVGAAIQLLCPTAGAEVRYTLNDTDPTETSTLAAAAIDQVPTVTITTPGAVTLKARAFKTGLSASNLLTLKLTVLGSDLVTAAPVLTQVAGTNQVTVSATPGTQVYLTTTGQTPTSADLFTAASLTLAEGTTTVQALAKSSGKQDSPLVTRAFTWTAVVVETVAAVVPSLVDGSNLVTTDSLTLTTATAGATIFYTLDGTDPLTSETKLTYQSALSLPLGRVGLKTAAIKTNCKASAVLSLTYQVSEVPPVGQVATPTITPIKANLYTDEPVTLATTTAGATIYYTLDGQDPTVASTPYQAPFKLAVGSVPVKAKAIKTGLTDSTVLSQTFAVTVRPLPDQVAAPAFSNPASVTTTTDITLTTATVGADIRYTLGTAVPTAASPLYDPVTKFRLPVGVTQVNAMALKTGLVDSPVVTQTFTVTQPFVGGLKVHVYGYTHAHYWNAAPAGSATATTWPGVAMKATVGKAGWYELDLPGVDSINFVFNNNGASQTADLVKILAGERWYKDGVWTEPALDDLVPPTVKWSLPTAGAAVSGTVSLTTTAADNIAVARVEYFCDTVSLGSVTAAPWSLSWNSALTTSGTKSLKAVAYDTAGNSATDTISVTTSNANLPPVANAGPDQTVLKGSTVQFNAGSSTDPNGTIVSYSWSNGLTGVNPTKLYPTVGTYTVTLTATDNDGAVGTDSLTINVVDQVPRGDMREESIYFLLPARFYDGDSTNNRYSNADKNSGNKTNGDPSWRGDFKGLIQKLDYIKALGFSAIWITPPVLNRSDMDYHGYHAWDMTKVDPRLESPDATYQDLINAAHAKGIKIIQDIVVNHSSKYGEKNLGGRYLWGDDSDPDWGAKSKGGKADYYDVKNPNFVYDGLSVEPISGKNTYNGDTWTKDKPVLPWDPTNPIAGWGTKTQWKSPEGWAIWNYQWSEGAYTILNPKYYHTTSLLNWEDYTCQIGTLHPDCVDLNTEGAEVQNYLINTYNRYIDMGVDGFRIDTAKHVSRVMFNRHFLPAWKQRGGDNFYMVGEVLTKIYEVWNKGVAPLSAPFYTWKERHDYSADDTLAAKEGYDWENGQGTGNQPTSQNAFLNGNAYRPIDYSKKSGLDVIDCRMHVNFANASSAFNVRNDDQFYNDATWNMVYVDSHDYGPSTSENRFAGGTSTWAENFSLMFTFRGIPTVYYGSEVEFKAGLPLGFDPNKLPLENSGRAYYGSQIEGSVTATDYGKWTGATGALATTLSKPLVGQLARLNQIRRAIPALQKGQYSTDGCSGNIAFKRRFTSTTVDSFVLVTISGGATFTGVPNGTYTDAVTGDVQTVSNGTLTANCSGSGNLRAYVLTTSLTPAPGKVGSDTQWIK